MFLSTDQSETECKSADKNTGKPYVDHPVWPPSALTTLINHSLYTTRSLNIDHLFNPIPNTSIIRENIPCQLTNPTWVTVKPLSWVFLGLMLHHCYQIIHNQTANWPLPSVDCFDPSHGKWTEGCFIARSIAEVLLVKPSLVSWRPLYVDYFFWSIHKKISLHWLLLLTTFSGHSGGQLRYRKGGREIPKSACVHPYMNDCTDEEREEDGLTTTFSHRQARKASQPGQLAGWVKFHGVL